MEKIVTALLKDRETANRLATDIMADCRCGMAEISIDARGLASPSRENAVMVTVHAKSSESAFCVSELMRRHGGKGIDARSVKPASSANSADFESLWGYSGPDRRGRKEPWDGVDRRRS